MKRVFIIAFVLLLISCKNYTITEKEMPIYEIQLPSMGTVGEPIQGSFTCMTENGCGQIERIEIIQQGNLIWCKAIAKYIEGDDIACSDSYFVYQREISYTPNMSGQYLFKFKAFSEGTYTVDTITVN